jgi:hypothetical protein
MQKHPAALRCSVISTADDANALATLEAAHQMTFFAFEEAVYRLTVRPLVPGEPGCETFGR